MTKRDIVSKLKTDLASAKALTKILGEDGGDLGIRLDAQTAYLMTLLEWIEQDRKV